MDDYKNRIEAILFTTGRLMDVEEIARLCSMGSIGIVKDLLEELKNDYENKGSALGIINEDNKFKLGIRKEYNYLTTNLINDSELDEPTTKTLALIAYKQPVIQSEIIEMRGNTAYDHIKILRDLGFIVSEKKGRTRLLKLASKFFDYFDVVENEVKAKISSEATKKLDEETKVMEDQLGSMNNKKDESKISEEINMEKDDGSQSNPPAAEEIDNEMPEKDGN